jgi:transcriptional regulator with XRE-family HTH domain
VKTREADGHVMQQRFRQLVEELGDELGRVHGWKREVARRLEMNPTHLSRVLNNENPPIGRETAMRVAHLLQIDMAYFAAREGSWRTFSRTSFSRTSGSDAEIHTMSALAALDDEARKRVLRWAAERWGA